MLFVKRVMRSACVGVWRFVHSVKAKKAIVPRADDQEVLERQDKEWHCCHDGGEELCFVKSLRVRMTMMSCALLPSIQPTSSYNDVVADNLRDGVGDVEGEEVLRGVDEVLRGGEERLLGGDRLEGLAEGHGAVADGEVWSRVEAASGLCAGVRCVVCCIGETIH